jgi:hypothetical protein
MMMDTAKGPAKQNASYDGEALNRCSINSRGGTRTRDPGIMSAGRAGEHSLPFSDNSARDVAESGGFLPPFTAKDTAKERHPERSVAREFATPTATSAVRDNPTRSGGLEHIGAIVHRVLGRLVEDGE